MIVIVALFTAMLTLSAQIDNGNITGRVIDPSGGGRRRCKDTLTQTETNFETDATSNQMVFTAR